jgi:hypothetical protein
MKNLKLHSPITNGYTASQPRLAKNVIGYRLDSYDCREQGLIIYYLDHLGNIVDYIKDFRNNTIDMCFTDGKTKQVLDTPYHSRYCYSPFYQENWSVLNNLIEISDMLELDYLVDHRRVLIDSIVCLNDPSEIATRRDFDFHIEKLIETFSVVQDKLKTKIKLLSEGEKLTFNEALNCYLDGCNYAAAAMSVYAIENRLFSLMLTKSSDGSLETFTVGQLIAKYLSDKNKYAKVIPEKHEALLAYSNTFKVFSINPTRPKITRPIATTILNMTFSFLFDETLKRPTS